MSIRDSLIEQLRQVVGPDDVVHIIPFQDSVDVIDRRTIMLKQTTISRATEAPNANLRIGYTLTFIAAAMDPAKAEPDLDEWVPAVLDDLRMNWFAWSTATKVLFGQNVAYDVDCYVLTTPTNDARKEQ